MQSVPEFNAYTGLLPWFNTTCRWEHQTHKNCWRNNGSWTAVAPEDGHSKKRNRVKNRRTIPVHWSEGRPSAGLPRNATCRTFQGSPQAFFERAAMPSKGQQEPFPFGTSAIFGLVQRTGSTPLSIKPLCPSHCPTCPRKLHGNIMYS